MATAPFAMMRAARGMSAVITKSPAVVCCAIWSSATSKPPSTITDVIRCEWDFDISWFATRQTGTSRRNEARNTISLMTRGHASASIQIFISISSGALSHAFNSEVDLLPFISLTSLQISLRQMGKLFHGIYIRRSRIPHISRPLQPALILQGILPHPLKDIAYNIADTDNYYR